MAQTINHGQIAQVNAEGDVDIFYPKTFSKDVYINSNKDTLEDFIGVNSNTLIDAIYPIGSIYLSVNNANPSGFIGGTWVEWGAGRVPVGVDANDAAFDTAEETGGEKTHTLTGAESGQKNLGNLYTNTVDINHYHAFSGTTSGHSADHAHYVSGTTGEAGAHSHGFKNGEQYVMNGGSGFSHDNGIHRGYRISTWSDAGNHTHSWGAWTGGVNTNHTHTYSGNTGWMHANNTHNHYTTISASNATNAHNNLQPYITCYMFKRTA